MNCAFYQPQAQELIGGGFRRTENQANCMTTVEEDEVEIFKICGQEG